MSIYSLRFAYQQFNAYGKVGLRKPIQRITCIQAHRKLRALMK